MQTTSQGFKYVEPADAITDFPAIDQTNWKLAEARTPRRVTSAQMTALTGLVDGQEIELEVDATLGIYWRLRYRAGSASASKWEFVGGPEYGAYMSAGANVSTAISDATWTALASDTILTLPRAGDYLIRAACEMWPAANGATMWFGVNLGGVDPTVDGARATGGYASGASIRQPMNLHAIALAVAAGATIALRYRHATGANQTINTSGRYLGVLPIRVA